MIESDLLLEKYRVQKKLSAESDTIREYLAKTRLAAEKVAQSYGFSLRYVQISNMDIQPASAPLRSAESSDSGVRAVGRESGAHPAFRGRE
ncbi:MAG: hypothetical protein LGR52_02855 [Candidatus Thiosymbion ectosymbiont of Robbea hypermnestra]|nr:hypothetical protein [Candidatus Thiosymbion ectosymbiont of Robbea hypermnestra]